MRLPWVPFAAGTAAGLLAGLFLWLAWRLPGEAGFERARGLAALASSPLLESPRLAGVLLAVVFAAFGVRLFSGGGVDGRGRPDFGDRCAAALVHALIVATYLSLWWR